MILIQIKEVIKGEEEEIHCLKKIMIEIHLVEMIEEEEQLEDMEDLFKEEGEEEKDSLMIGVEDNI